MCDSDLGRRCTPSGSGPHRFSLPISPPIRWAARYELYHTPLPGPSCLCKLLTLSVSATQFVFSHVLLNEAEGLRNTGVGCEQCLGCLPPHAHHHTCLSSYELLLQCFGGDAGDPAGMVVAVGPAGHLSHCTLPALISMKLHGLGSRFCNRHWVTVGGVEESRSAMRQDSGTRRPSGLESAARAVPFLHRLQKLHTGDRKATCPWLPVLFPAPRQRSHIVTLDHFPACSS